MSEKMQYETVNVKINTYIDFGIENDDQILNLKMVTM